MKLTDFLSISVFMFAGSALWAQHPVELCTENSQTVSIDKHFQVNSGEACTFVVPFDQFERAANILTQLEGQNQGGTLTVYANGKKIAYPGNQNHESFAVNLYHLAGVYNDNSRTPGGSIEVRVRYENDTNENSSVNITFKETLSPR